MGRTERKTGQFGTVGHSTKLWTAETTAWQVTSGAVAERREMNRTQRSVYMYIY